MELANSLEDSAALGHSLNRVGNWFLNREQPRQALRYHHKALKIFQDLNDAHGRAETLDLLGVTSYNVGDLIQGTEYFHQAINLLRELDDRELLTSSLIHLTMASGFDVLDTEVPAATVDQAIRIRSCSQTSLWIFTFRQWSANRR